MTATHPQTSGNESRLSLQAIGVTKAGATYANMVTPNMTTMLGYANSILNSNGLPMLTKNYAPNEMTSLLHDLQNRLGI